MGCTEWTVQYNKVAKNIMKKKEYKSNTNLKKRCAEFEQDVQRIKSDNLDDIIDEDIYSGEYCKRLGHNMRLVFTANWDDCIVIIMRMGGHKIAYGSD